MKTVFPTIGGAIGAVLGFIGALVLLELVGFAIPADPIMSGLLALLVFGPAGAIGGLIAGVKLARSANHQENAGTLGTQSFKAFGLVLLIMAVAGGSYFAYSVATATPWLNPNAPNPLLQFEVRLPAGSATPTSPGAVEAELQTDINRMPAELQTDRFRRDGARSVIVGEVDLAFRTPNRQLEIKIAGQPTRVYRIGLTGKAPHTAALGGWEPLSDGSEIRYRAKWPGQD